MQPFAPACENSHEAEATNIREQLSRLGCRPASPGNLGGVWRQGGREGDADDRLKYKHCTGGAELGGRPKNTLVVFSSLGLPPQRLQKAVNMQGCL